MMGNEGAYLPSDGNGNIPDKYWQTVHEAAKLAETRGLIKTDKDRTMFLDSIKKLLTPQQGLPIADAITSGELIKKYLATSGQPIEFEGLHTGLQTLDDLLLGVQQQNFMVVCARTGVGKTLIANYMVAYFASQGEKILYLALEENEMEVGDRWTKIVRNNNINVPDDSVGFLYNENISAIKDDKYNIIPLVAAASQLGYTMICVDMLNNLIDTVRDEHANAFLNRLLDEVHRTGMTLIMTARLRQPHDDHEKDFPSMESVYGRVDLGYIVSKCIGVTALPDELDGHTYLRLHVLKNRRKQIGMKFTYPKIRVSNLLEITDCGDDGSAAEELDKYENGVKFGGRSNKPPRGDAEGAERAF